MAAPTRARQGRRADRAAGLTPAVCDHWRHIIDRLYIGRAPDGKVFEQFEGYFRRRDVNLATLEPRHCSVQALLGLKATNETQVLKQPDVLMLLSLLPRNLTRQRSKPTGTTIHRVPISPMARR